MERTVDKMAQFGRDYGAFVHVLSRIPMREDAVLKLLRCGGASGTMSRLVLVDFSLL